MMNSRGDLVREDRVKEIDKLKDATVREIVEQAKKLNRELAALKKKALDDVADIIDIAADKYDVVVGGEKGNVTINSYDGRYRVQRVFSDRIGFGVELEAAKKLFSEYLDQATESVTHDAKVLINGAFRASRNGQLRTAELLRLLTYDIKDPRWVKACEALKDSIFIEGNTVYIRIYERVNESDQYMAIPLDIASVRTA